ncbi:MAG: HAD family hydrolase [Saprospirales bacterium]|nr:HAD family hydrolase [Saprospirales bacterium]
MKTLILFDVDGTLIHSNRNDSLSFAETYEELYGKPFPTIDWHTYPHVTDTAILQSVLEEHFQRGCNAEEIDLFQDHYIARMQSKRERDASPYCEVPFAREAMERLLEDPRFCVGIATGGWERTALFKLQYLSFPVDRIPLAGADGKHNREAILEDAIQRSRELHPQISRIVYIGDAIWDVRTTRSMNLSFVGIRVRGDVELLHREGVSHVFCDYSGYEEFVGAIDAAVPPANFPFSSFVTQ